MRPTAFDLGNRMTVRHRTTSGGRRMERTSETKRRRERIERAVRELSQAIEHGEGVDVALDHLCEAKDDGTHPHGSRTTAA
jgi:hypothetical protein